MRSTRGRAASAGGLLVAAGLLVLGTTLSPAAGAEALPTAGAPASVPAARGTSDPRAFTVYHYDTGGHGVVPGVTSVDTSNRAWTSPRLDGQIYGEPLVASGAVFVATENDSVYALSVSTGKIIWERHIASPVQAGSLPCGDISPVVGITGTPVIDQTRQEIFVVADESIGGNPKHVLVGLATTTGKIEMTKNVDPAGSNHAALLQRTGLTIDGGRVVFGFGGNYGDCATYHGWVVTVSETGGTPLDFEVDAGLGETQGAVWMGGAAPVVTNAGDIMVEAGNGSVTSPSGPYDHSDSVLELSASLQLLQYFAPSSWASDNASDRDMSAAPALLADGEVVAAGKSDTAFLLSGSHLGGIGGAQARLPSICGDDIDGGPAVVGAFVYLPCLGDLLAVQAIGSTSLSLAWSSGVGGGPPIVADGLVWTMSGGGQIYALDPKTGHVRQQAPIGAPANHFPSPSIGDGLLVAAASDFVVAFTATEKSSGPTSTTTTLAGGVATTTPGGTATATSVGAPTTDPKLGGHNSGLGAPGVAAIVVVGLACGAGAAWVLAKRRRTADSSA